jgi:hypothetical protein
VTCVFRKMKSDGEEGDGSSVAVSARLQILTFCTLDLFSSNFNIFC